MRITLIHALKHSIVPIEASFAKHWPEARLMNLLDDSLSADLARDGKLTERMTGRFLTMGQYAASTGADGSLCVPYSAVTASGSTAAGDLAVLRGWRGGDCDSNSSADSRAARLAGGLGRGMSL